MGILRDKDYWGRVINRIEAMRPLPGEVMPRDNAVAVLREACRAFSDLVEDPNFEADLKEAASLGLHAHASMPRGDAAFQNFISRFRHVEREVLIQSGVSEAATVAIDAELATLVRATNASDFDRVMEKIVRIRDVCCQYARDPAYRNDPPPELAADALEALKGVAIVGTDLGIMAKTGEIGDALIGTSIGVGLSKFRPLLRRIW